MKVLHVLNHFFPSHFAGTEVYVKNLIDGLTKSGVKGIVLIPSFDNEIATEYCYDSIEVFSFTEMTSVDRAILNGTKKPTSLTSFFNSIKSINPDLIHFHEFSGSRGVTFFHLQLAKENGYKTVVTFHLAGYSCRTGELLYKSSFPCDGQISLSKCSACYLQSHIGANLSPLVMPFSNLFFSLDSDPRFLNNAIGTLLGTHFMIDQFKNRLNEMYNHADSIVVLSDWYKTVLSLNLDHTQKLNLIKTGIKKPLKSVKSTFCSGGILKLIYVGRITKIKGLHLLIEALQNMKTTNWILDIYGKSADDDVEYEQKLHDASKSIKNITWKGELDHSGIHSVLIDYDLLCVPSIVAEMSSMVIHEALSIKLPVLASSNPGNLEVLDKGQYGILFESNNISSLKHELEKLVLSSTDLIDISNRIPDINGFESMITSHHNLYNSLLA